jgi:DNA helicase-2/ATP-dependent DNA helicase PcrA
MAIEDLGVPALSVDLLLVDEYQDLNRADIKLIRLIAESGFAVVAIGDEDQSIYGYRHAAPEGIREFPSDFKIDAKDDYRLTISRRCGAAILKSAQDLIEQAPGRPRQAPMKPFDRSKPGDIAYLRFDDMAQEAQGVASIVAARIAAGVPAKNVIVPRNSRFREGCVDKSSLQVGFAGCNVPNSKLSKIWHTRHSSRVPALPGIT